MKTATQSNYEISNKEEILNIMVTALNQEWDFSCLSMVKNHLSSQPVRLLDINTEAGKITVDFKESTLVKNRLGTQVFRVHAGGMSYAYKTRLLDSGSDKSSSENPQVIQFEYPGVLRFSQLRNAIRINLADWQDISVAFFTDDAIQLVGNVVDISATGAKIRFKGDFLSQAGHSNLVADCQLRLPDESQILTRAQVLGVVYDKAQDISYIRCKYLGLNQSDKMQLEQLIDERLGRSEHLQLASA